MSETETDTLWTALLAFQQESPTLQKDAVNPHFRNKYVSLDGLTQTITPILCRHGLVWTTLPVRDSDGTPALHYQLVHAPSGQKLEGVMPLMLAKDDSQGQGSALTYARRYAASAVLGLSAEDDDGNSASRAPAQARKANGNGGNGNPDKMATDRDVAEMQAAAKGLQPDKFNLALAACGIEGVTAYNKVPAEKVAALVKALSGIERA